MPKKITIERLAQMVLRGFQASATKDDLKALATKEDLRSTEKRLAQQFDSLEAKVSARASLWEEDFRRLHDWVKDHEQRLKSIERARR